MSLRLHPAVNIVSLPFCKTTLVSTDELFEDHYCGVGEWTVIVQRTIKLHKHMLVSRFPRWSDRLRTVVCEWFWLLRSDTIISGILFREKLGISLSYRSVGTNCQRIFFNIHWVYNLPLLLLFIFFINIFALLFLPLLRLVFYAHPCLLQLILK